MISCTCVCVFTPVIMALEGINKQMDDISEKMIDIEKSIIKGDTDNKDVHAKIYATRKLYLRAQLTLNQQLLSGKLQQDDIGSTLRRLRLINKNLNFLDRYYNNIMQVKQKQSIDSLTLVTLVFLPLTLITGYFGMNFKAMGSPSMGRGIFTWRRGEHLVFFLFIISIVVILALVKMDVIYG